MAVCARARSRSAYSASDIAREMSASSRARSHTHSSLIDYVRNGPRFVSATYSGNLFYLPNWTNRKSMCARARCTGTITASHSFENTNGNCEISECELCTVAAARKEKNRYQMDSILNKKEETNRDKSIAFAVNWNTHARACAKSCDSPLDDNNNSKFHCHWTFEERLIPMNMHGSWLRRALRRQTSKTRTHTYDTSN